jgi:hypothetical protein
VKITLTGLQGAPGESYAGQSVIEITPNTTTTVLNLVSTTFGGPRTADIEHNVTNPEFAPVSVSIIANKFTNVNISMDWWFSPNMFRVYIDSGYQTLIGDFDLNSMQTIATEIRITSNTHALAMTPSTTLYFRAYRNNMNQGSASATAEQLLDPNFVLAFN